MRRVIEALRHSMAVQISIAIAATAIIVVCCSAFLLERQLAAGLRREGELQLLASLGFLRDDLIAMGGGAAQLAPELVDRFERRRNRMRAAIFDDERRLIAGSSHFELHASDLPERPFEATLIPEGIADAGMEAVRERLARQTVIRTAPDGSQLRTLTGRVEPSGGPALLVMLTIDTSRGAEARHRDRLDFGFSLLLVGALTSLAGIWIARRILAGTRRFDQAISRISANALSERLSLAQTPTELVDAMRGFNLMLDRLEGAFERLSAFSSDLAHDMRTPISNLLGEAQVALSRPRTADEYRQVLESAVEEYERLSRMIGNMLFLARADDHQSGFVANWVDLRRIVPKVMAYFEGLAEEREVRLGSSVTESDASELKVWADESMLIRALSNLLSNALRHTPAGGSVMLHAASGLDLACTLAVANDGAPIPLEWQERIFERHFRGDAAREGGAARDGSAGGSGLGLAIVRSIMDLHNGQVSVRSRPGEPTVFTLRFPARIAVAA